ncbi:HAD-IIIC family phosphatase [Aureimonas leprariae]|uniref:HAD-IIIC family phosphatase n=1 Tax=Plantimonas leprariae TaxID=2615207 RepID=A0A7V7PS59_9HYPH|nr:HAD-IIIC family phosphatase [Aureimonas leprariae]KAB0681871.1 HAD-IIIC family phosphatase [Aureimonas leprariae]
MALLPLLGADAASVAELATALAGRCSVPILVVSGDGDRSLELPGVEAVGLGLGGPVIDDRFGSTFGAIPTPEAADRIADLAAARATRILGTAAKLLVTDLDGTLWSGTLAEDGKAGIALDTSFAATLKALAADGLLLAVASRNDRRDVERVFADNPDWPLTLQGFAEVEASWAEKDALVATVLGELGLSAEHLVFVDDDPVNCAKVATRFPDADVRLIAGDREAFARTLHDDPLLRQGGTASGDRVEQYRRREAVERLRSETADVSDFLRRLRSALTVEPLKPSLLPRAAELASRVNQFALNGWRPNGAELAHRASPLDFMVRLDDAFGAHGLVGLVLASVEGRTARMEAFFLSCRALGRGAEAAMLQALGRLAHEAGCTEISGTIEHLPRNEPARAYFSQYLDEANGSSWTIRLDAKMAAIEGTTLRWARTMI